MIFTHLKRAIVKYCIANDIEWAIYWDVCKSFKIKTMVHCEITKIIFVGVTPYEFTPICVPLSIETPDQYCSYYCQFTVLILSPHDHLQRCFHTNISTM